MSGLGLSGVSAPMLELIEAGLVHGRLPCPFTSTDLAGLGFRGPATEVLEALAGVDRVGVLAAIGVALAERRHRPPPRLDLVWTGPETKASVARSTALAVEQLFSEATREVILGGYAFDSAEILEPLHRVMRERGVSVTCFLDLQGHAESVADVDSFAARQIERFFRDVWIFGGPRPEIYYDPRTAVPGPPWASLHAKCIVVDDRRSFVTSANFTDRGQSRNIEVGVLIDDVHFAEQLAGHWRQLLGEGLVRKFGG